ncbi:MAG: S53 family peptidase [Mycobacteriales bacterium]
MRAPLHRIGTAAAAVLALAALPAVAAGTARATLGTARATPGTARATPGEVPSWATAADSAGVLPSGSTVQVGLVLGYRDPAGLARFIAAVSDPTSPRYGHYLTPTEFDARYAPTPGDAAAAVTWLRAAGLSVDRVSASRVLVLAHGSAARVDRAFATTLGLFRHRGLLLRAPLTPPVLPASLGAADVTGVIGLAQQPHYPQASPPPAFVNAPPCSTYSGQLPATGLPKAYGRVSPYVVCGFTPGQVRSAYGVSSTGLTGAGVRVGIVDAYASPTVASDVNTYSLRHGLPPLRPGQLVQNLYPGATSVPEQPVAPFGLLLLDPQGWAGEETLDAEAVHTMAPAAGIDYYAATDVFTGLDVAELDAVEAHQVDVISNSWGNLGESPLPGSKQLDDEIFSQAAATGIAIFFSSGDEGDDVAATGSRQADFPATSPLVTAVGGTSLSVSRTGGYAGETAWGTSEAALSGGSWTPALPGNFLYGGGGGVSTLYPEPAYQQGIVPNYLATYGGVPPGRVVPDVSLDADPNTGFIVGQTQTFPDGSVRYSEYRIGGTSLSCPLFAGIMALADQVAGHSLGYVTPALYSVYRRDRGAFRDILPNPPAAVVRVDYVDGSDAAQGTKTTLRSFGTIGTLHALPGYDDSTGLGSPVAPLLVRALG